MIDEQSLQKVIESNTIIRAVVGSEAHGLSLGGSDRDEMGVCVEPIELAQGFHNFEQFEYRSAAVREGKSDAPSQPGDLDLTIYGLRKFLRLAMKGNPSVVVLLFLKQEHCLVKNAAGSQLQELAPFIISRQAGKAFLGYMESQRQRLLGERGQKKVNRPELEELYGYDTKYAMHILRLGLQGVELLETGRLTLPMEQADRDYLLGVRKGHESFNAVLNRAGDLEREVKDLLGDSPLRESPDQAYVESWMIKRYWEFWKSQRVLIDAHGEPLRPSHG